MAGTSGQSAMDAGQSMYGNQQPGGALGGLPPSGGAGLAGSGNAPFPFQMGGTGGFMAGAPQQGGAGLVGGSGGQFPINMGNPGGGMAGGQMPPQMMPPQYGMPRQAMGGPMGQPISDPRSAGGNFGGQWQHYLARMRGQ